MSRADRYQPLDADAAQRWSRFGVLGEHGVPEIYIQLLGLQVEEVRLDYCRMRLPFRPVLLQAGGVVHGGAIASLLDTVVVPAVGGPLEPGMRFSTVDMHVQFITALVDDDAVAEGWVVKRGRRTVFVEAEAVAARSGALVARSLLTYVVSPPR